jgi:hypothetical protein
MSAQLRQQALSFTVRGQLQANKPGPLPKAPTTMSAAIATALISGSKRRRQVSGVNEAEAIEAFRNSRAHFDAREPDSGSAHGLINRKDALTLFGTCAYKAGGLIDRPGRVFQLMR